MPDLPFDENTPLIRIWETYPWLSEVLPALDKRFAVMNTPLGKPLMRKSTVADLSRLSGFTPAQLLEMLRLEVEKRESR